MKYEITSKEGDEYIEENAMIIEEILRQRYQGIKNEKGVYIRVTTDKRGKDHIDIYDRDPSDKNHSSIHIQVKVD